MLYEHSYDHFMAEKGPLSPFITLFLKPSIYQVPDITTAAAKTNTSTPALLLGWGRRTALEWGLLDPFKMRVRAS